MKKPLSEARLRQLRDLHAKNSYSYPCSDGCTCGRHDRSRYPSVRGPHSPETRAKIAESNRKTKSGIAPSFDAVHGRLVKERGRASVHTCHDCRKPAREWSYQGNAPEELVSSHGPYTSDLSFYVPRCVRCHRKYDSPKHPRRYS